MSIILACGDLEKAMEDLNREPFLLAGRHPSLNHSLLLPLSMMPLNDGSSSHVSLLFTWLMLQSE